jgi:hypothetical protein
MTLGYSAKESSKGPFHSLVPQAVDEGVQHGVITVYITEAIVVLWEESVIAEQR